MISKPACARGTVRLAMAKVERHLSLYLQLKMLTIKTSIKLGQMLSALY